MTRRLVRAMKLPLFKIWGHARGRLLLEREPFACRMEEVLDALAGSRGAVEVNGDPKRLELDPARPPAGRGSGAFRSCSRSTPTPPARSATCGTPSPRRGVAGSARGEVLNALPAAEFQAAVRPGA